MEDGVNSGAVAAVGGAGGAFDARLIPEFDGAGDVVQWHTRAQMLCELRGASLAAVLPLRLTGGAFAVWSQMPVADRGSADAVRDALFTAFAPDPFTAYEAFVSRRLQHGESADVFLADLRRLAALFGGVPDRMLVCAFVAGLPETTRQVIRAGTRAESLELASVLARARAVLSDEQRRINVITVSGGRYECRGTGPVRVGVCSGVSADVNALVVADRPLGFDLVLGMDAVVALGGVTVKSADESVFGCELTEVAGGAAGEPVAARPAPPVSVTGGAVGEPVAARPAPPVSVTGGAAGEPVATRPARPVSVTGGAAGEPVAARPARPVSVTGGAVGEPVAARPAPPVSVTRGAAGEPVAARPARPVSVTGGAAGELVAARPAPPVSVTGGAAGEPVAARPAGSATVAEGAAAAATSGTRSPEGLTVEAKDFVARFDGTAQVWTVAWKWADGVGPDCLSNRVAEYRVPPAVRQEYDAELESWLRNGWLQPYDEAVHGPPRGLVPLMAVPQANKVRPVLDMRELNAHVAAYSADADVCAEHLRKWRRHGRRVAVVDLRRAYLQLRLDRRLWPYQTVMLHGRRHCLTRLGFGLNVAPLLMKAVVRAVLSQDSAVERAVSPYVDDLLVDEEVVSAERVVEHFRRFGLECKPPARAEDGARMLGLRVQPVAGELQWSRDCAVVPPPEVVTRRAVFAWCGRLVAHFPVCGWLRPAAAWVKRHVNQLTEGWDDATDDGTLSAQIAYIQERLAGADPARGQWCWTGDRAVVWADASSIAFGVVIETPDGGVMEDASWLRPSGSSAHINMAELDAAVRGLNLAIAWGATEIELRTDSATVHRWLSDALSGRTRLRTRAAGEMLIRRRVSLIRELTEELQLELTVTLVRSAENLADALTRVPKDWVREQSAADGVPAEAAAVGAEDDAAGAGAEGELAASVRAVHERAGHPGIRRTLYFARRDVSCDVPRATVRAVVRGCDICRSIDPAPVRWRHGSLGVKETWQRVAMDVTHYQGRAYLSVIDCGPSRFCVWRQLRRADAVEVCGHLEQMFHERGAPTEILADNDTVFRGRQVAALTARWGVSLRFRAVHQPGGNGVVERCHRSIKVIAARRTCSVAEAVHIYNVTPRDGETTGSAPAAGVYRYAMRDCIRPAAAGESADQEPPAVSDGEQLRVGDQVWMRRRGTRCTDTSRRGVVTSGVSRQVVEVDGVPWHVRDLRPRHESPCRDDGDDAQSDGEAPPIIVDLPSGGDERPADVAADGPPLRRSERERRPPRHWCEC
ncbi:Retrovirus-related Pol polyprotein from transposon 297 [Amphibalanus amphitrite]|uniref:RNA-directed DNA polymerase n=1 Tax=Amphibalanus amphitrite TaxID=1232801 RepID=A0A6A4WZX7_AMPAM|nr:Retrovirus-related Pol polyprotein from transposon 297 [Amphibalanus amphitrite]